MSQSAGAYNSKLLGNNYPALFKETSISEANPLQVCAVGLGCDKEGGLFQIWENEPGKRNCGIVIDHWCSPAECRNVLGAPNNGGEMRCRDNLRGGWFSCEGDSHKLQFEHRGDDRFLLAYVLGSKCYMKAPEHNTDSLLMFDCRADHGDPVICSCLILLN